MTINASPPTVRPPASGPRSIGPTLRRRIGRPISLAQAAKNAREGNNFDLLRLAAATCVVFGHSFAVLLQSEPLQWRSYYSWGFVGVVTFFAISGFLVARSWSGDPRLLSFALKRTLRLMPGLIVALLLTTLVLGPVVTTYPGRGYLEDPATKAYLLDNATLQINYSLPGVFIHNIYPVAVNGSLWTLPVEVKAYAIVAVVGLLGLLSRWRWAMLAVAVFAVLACIESLLRSVSVLTYFTAFLANIQMSPAVIAGVKTGLFTSGSQVFAVFAVAAMLYALRSTVWLRWDVAGLCVGAIVAAGFTDSQTAVLLPIVLSPYVILCLAFRTRSLIRLPAWFGDYSYGLYIYAFPVQQTISLAISPGSGWVMFFLALPITLACAAASWHFVERPALSLKTRFSGGELPAGASASSWA